MSRWVGLLGLLFLLTLAYLLSRDRKNIDFRLVLSGVCLQFTLAVLVLGIPALGISGPLSFFFDAANTVILLVLEWSLEGSRFVFGQLANRQEVGFLFAFQVIPSVIFIASLMGVLYYLGVMQFVVKCIAIVMYKTMRISGAESLSVAASFFVGQTEAPLLIKPYLRRMTESELFTIMVGGMATVAGGVLAAYVGLLKDRIPDIGRHLLTACVMSAPAAVVISKLMLPETKKPDTLGGIPKATDEHKLNNIAEAAAVGATDGLTLGLSVVAMLIAFIALVAMVNSILGTFGDWIHFSSWAHDWVPAILHNNGVAHLDLSVLFGWLLSPLAWLMGVPWSDAPVAGALIGEKISLNEFVAYLHLSQEMHKLDERSVIILSYALCGFANFSSIGIQIGGIGAIAPERRGDLAKLGLRAVIAGSLATFMTATLAGLII